MHGSPVTWSTPIRIRVHGPDCMGLHPATLMALDDGYCIPR